MRYPTDTCLSYSELAGLVRSTVPLSDAFVLVAESFSTPLAIQYAAACPSNLRGLILCAGFASSPVRGWVRSICSALAPLLFRVGPPDPAIRLLLVGPNASNSVVAAVRTAISCVRPVVVSTRLRMILACNAEADLAPITVPILYIQARQDRLVRPSNFAEILRIQPKTRLETVDGPHLILQKEPQRTAAIVAKFVRQLI